MNPNPNEVSPTELRRRLGYPVRVAGIDDLTSGLGDAARHAGQGAHEAGTGVGQAGQGLGTGATNAGAGVRDAAGHLVDTAGNALDSAETAAKWLLGLAVGIPVAAILVGSAVAIAVGRRAAPVAVQYAPELLGAFGGPQGAAFGAALGAARASRTRPDAPQAFREEAAQLLGGRVREFRQLGPGEVGSVDVATEHLERKLGLAPGTLASQQNGKR